MTSRIEDLFCAVPSDALLDLGLSSAELHLEESNEEWKDLEEARVDVLELGESAPIFGRPISIDGVDAPSSHWTMLDITSMPSVFTRLSTLFCKGDAATGNSSFQHKICSIVLAVPRSGITLPQTGQSLMKALYTKYMSSQELKDARYSDTTSLSSSGSSWQSGTSLTVDLEGVQVIGAMGGKSIEFHKPKGRENETLGAMPVNLSVCQMHPHISLHDMSVNAFVSGDMPALSLAGLKSLDLSNNFICSWAHVAVPIISSAPTIETLNLSSNLLHPIEFDTCTPSAEIDDFFKKIHNWLNTASKEKLHIFIKKSVPQTSESSQNQIAKNSLELSASFLENSRVFAPSRSLTTLVLNKTGITWTSFVAIASSLQVLQEAHLCFNRLKKLFPEKILLSERVLGSASLRNLNLDENELEDFENIAAAIQPFPNLNKLVLSNNPISSIPLLQLPSGHPFTRAYNPGDSGNHWAISLTATSIVEWTSIQNLAQMVPDLQEIRFQRNLMLSIANSIAYAAQLSTTSHRSSEKTEEKVGEQENLIKAPSTQQISDQVCRHYVVAMCPRVLQVNGSMIGPIERTDAERLYLVHFFGAVSPSRLPTPGSDPTKLIEELSGEDSAIAHLWSTVRESCLEAFARAHPSAGSVGSSGAVAGSGIVMIDVTVCDENAEFMLTKKLPASTSLAKLRGLVSAAIETSSVKDRFQNFVLELMEPTFQGPPSFHALTLEQSTLGQETSRLKIGIVLRPK